MEDVAKLVDKDFNGGGHTHAFRSTAGGTGTGSTDTDKQEDDDGQWRPHFRVDAGETGGGLERGDIEEGLAQGVEDADVFLEKSKAAMMSVEAKAMVKK